MQRALRQCVAVAAAVLVAGLAGALTLPGTAAAHVSISGDAQRGGFARVAVRVPNESDSATTTRLELYLPENQVIPFVSVMPVPGWTAVAERKTLNPPAKTQDGEVTEMVAKITWTASSGSAIKAGEFMEFPLSLGPLPAVDELVFKALQTYSDGSTVRWIEEPGADGKEPEHPAPTLKLAAAAGAGSAAAGPAATGAEGGGDSTGDAALWVSVVALLAGVGGLALGGLAYVRSRR